ncbi:MAG TPA: TadE/TadG family type IV pilus assembly protein [Anaerolineales bacterium]|nr:TadE/TadG family type IV pilus assembly protein [Anaerolineales bacterium]HNA88598.1 TadE/TadG family type IV pilus assembly protein [Anaerolineales bacterium]HNB35234.1 TadE/TadG family type IV pilus assembly protein [Anaerolineales bacterium]HNC07645.1 TadE/TadG family type IV pilus assembly protein [Anaerolineales bacterium]
MKIKLKKKKYFFSVPAQAMVEFAMVLPLLLILLYGIIELSRLVFIFASVANASRQAARYGAGSGEFDGITYYQDCDGIRDVANQSAILVDFDDINITYDRGLTPDGEQLPILDIDPNPNADTCPVGNNIIRNGDRIIVQVSASYEPILPLLPFEPLEVVSANARTFLISVPIFGSAFPTGFAAESSTPSKAPTNTFTGNETSTFTPIPPFASSTSQPTTEGTYVPGATSTPRIPTNTVPPSLTFTPSFTPLPSISPTSTATAILCTGEYSVSHGPLIIRENVMEMSINNNTGHTLTTAQIYVEWNHDTGHNSEENPSLHLTQVFFAGQTWQGDVFAPSSIIQAFNPRIPQGESVIKFFFNQTYNISDGTERIIITIGTPGCINYPVDSSK